MSQGVVGEGDVDLGFGAFDGGGRHYEARCAECGEDGVSMVDVYFGW